MGRAGEWQSTVMGKMERQGGSQTTEALEYHANNQGGVLWIMRTTRDFWEATDKIKAVTPEEVCRLKDGVIRQEDQVRGCYNSLTWKWKRRMTHSTLGKKSKQGLGKRRIWRHRKGMPKLAGIGLQNQNSLYMKYFSLENKMLSICF